MERAERTLETPSDCTRNKDLAPCMDKSGGIHMCLVYSCYMFHSI